MAAAETYPWVELIKSAKKTCLVQDGRKKIHFTFPDGREMVEEFDITNGVLLVRKWKTKSTLGAEGKWDYEVGEEYRGVVNLDNSHIMESNTNPIFTRRDTRKEFQFRIRNLPYPKNVYSITVEDEKTIVVRTSNKKYYKRICVPDMERANVLLEQDNISFAHANNTLIITYKKPAKILKMEEILIKEYSRIKSMDEPNNDCKPS